MNKAQLIEQLSQKTRMPKSQSEEVLNATLEIITQAVSRGDEVKLVGFGTFDRSRRKARTGRNPKTGKIVKVPPKKVPFFKVGKELKEMVDAGKDKYVIREA